MQPKTLTEETELLADILSHAEWANLPITKITSEDTLSFEGDLLKRVYFLVEDERSNPITLLTSEQDPRFDQLMSAMDYATDWFLKRNMDRFPIVNFRHTWDLVS